MTVFIRKTPMDGDTTSECIRTVTEMYMVVEFHNFTNTKRMSMDTKRTVSDIPQENQFIQHIRQTIIGLRSLCMV